MGAYSSWRHDSRKSACALNPLPSYSPWPWRRPPGIQQQAVALLETSSRPGSGPSDHRFVLFVPAPDADKERWDGAWLGSQAAKDVFGADEVGGGWLGGCAWLQEWARAGR